MTHNFDSSSERPRGHSVLIFAGLILASLAVIAYFNWPQLS